MTAEPRGGGVFPTPPANYQAGSLNSKQPVPTLACEICSFIQKVSICPNELLVGYLSEDEMQTPPPPTHTARFLLCFPLTPSVPDTLHTSSSISEICVLQQSFYGPMSHT